MSKPEEHIERITAEINEMAAEGHFNDFDQSVAAGAVEQALSRLVELLDE